MQKKAKKVIVGIVGAGGREHALAIAYAKSKLVDEIIIVPGNDFIKEDIQRRFEKPVRTYPGVKLTDADTIVSLLQKEHVTLSDVAQDNAIAVNVAGRMRDAGFLAVGPDAAGSKIESDKAWFRMHATTWGVPQPAYAAFTDPKDAITWVRKQSDKPYYIKAAYLAEGKGVVPAENKIEAQERITELVKRFPDAAKKIVIEEWVKHCDGEVGDEFSTFLITDGKTYQLVGSAVDYKRVYDHDEGENTGSMGSNSQTNLLPPKLITRIKKEIAEPIINGLRQEGIVYQGIIYISGIVLRQKNGEVDLKVIETNSRWGDPEAQVIIPSIINDFYTLMRAVATKTLETIKITTDKKYRVVVSGVSRGYPLDYAAVKGKRIVGLKDILTIPGITVYGAGIAVENSEYLANGGRVFYVMGEGKTLIDAREDTYAALAHVSIEGDNLHYRTDIGMRDILRKTT